MTADQIRKEYQWDTMEPVHAPLLQIEVMGEIAAQLAELNEKLTKLVEPAVGITVSLAATNDTIPVSIRG